ncbi:(deoxy)nucleoside triphosphate pyrophosphohydrolase [Nakamurella antarctica]|uniref:8-oxo-dGTP diphosphatase n=2 Tax=Nakamurella antarctica TaxID=1902245 RepID=A0A3G8ZZD1_9ACTN|nr:(deoxy)nucleoside triphosphate pyrophosphohydrolase [Nakamurella antarctica]
MHENVVVVGAAVIRDGAVLAARRTYPQSLAGKWELPGGKVEPGESDKSALVREMHEELGMAVEVGEQIGDDVALDVEKILRVYRVTLLAGEPLLTEHDEVRWLRADQLGEVDWLPGDVVVLPALAAALNANL